MSANASVEFTVKSRLRIVEIRRRGLPWWPHDKVVVEHEDGQRATLVVGQDLFVEETVNFTR